MEEKKSDKSGFDSLVNVPNELLTKQELARKSEELSRRFHLLIEDAERRVDRMRNGGRRRFFF